MTRPDDVQRAMEAAEDLRKLEPDAAVAIEGCCGRIEQLERERDCTIEKVAPVVARLRAEVERLKGENEAYSEASSIDSNELTKLGDHIAALRKDEAKVAIVDAVLNAMEGKCRCSDLPLTADGVRVVPGKKGEYVYHPELPHDVAAEFTEMECTSFSDDEWRAYGTDKHGETVSVPVSECTSKPDVPTPHKGIVPTVGDDDGSGVHYPARTSKPEGE